MRFSRFSTGDSCMFIIRGTEGPKTSASSNPMDFFGSIIFRAVAKFTAVVDFPTPPLPEAIRKICLTPFIRFRFGRPRAMTSLCLASRCSCLVLVESIIVLCWNKQKTGIIMCVSMGEFVYAVTAAEGVMLSLFTSNEQ